MMVGPGGQTGSSERARCTPSPSGWSPLGSRLWPCRRSWCLRPGKAARPTPPTPTRSPSSRGGCWPTARTSSAPPAPSRSADCNGRWSSSCSGGAKKALTARQGRALPADVPAGDVVRETRWQLAGELVDELELDPRQIGSA